MNDRASLPSRLELSHYQELTLAKREEKYSEYLLDRFLAALFKCRICITLESYTLRYRPTTRNAPKASTRKPSDGTSASTPEWSTTWSEPQKLTRRHGSLQHRVLSTADLRNETAKSRTPSSQSTLLTSRLH